MKLNRILSIACLTSLSVIAYGQSFTTTNNGAWTTGSNWAGGTAAPTTGQSWGTNNINNNMTITGDYSFGGSAVNLKAGKTLTITGNFALIGGADFNVSGNLNITGNATLSASLNISPGGVVTVDGDVTVDGSTYLNVGTNATPGAYADMIIKGNLIAKSGGRTTLEKNARLVVYKDYVNSVSGGSRLIIKSGAQVYINGKIDMTFGGDQITNANGTTPIGFYLDGAVSMAGGGSSISANRGTKATMKTNDLPFYNWIAGLTDSPLPITLVNFKISSAEEQIIKLDWSTASEKNFDKFIVQRSADGVAFENIAEIAGAGNSKVLLNYTYSDQNPLTGKSYYRLKSSDFDGSFEYSKVIFADVDGAKSISIYPNPSTGESIRFSANFDAQESGSIVVIDFLGSEVTKVSVKGSTGEIVFNTPLRSGTYIVKYASAGFQKIERLIVK